MWFIFLFFFLLSAPACEQRTSVRESSLKTLVFIRGGMKKEKQTRTEIFMTFRPFLGSSLFQGEQSNKCSSRILLSNANVSQRSVYVKSKYREAFAIVIYVLFCFIFFESGSKLILLFFILGIKDTHTRRVMSDTLELAPAKRRRD